MKRLQRFQARRNHRRFSHNATNIRVAPAAIAAATASAPHLLLVSTTTSTAALPSSSSVPSAATSRLAPTVTRAPRPHRAQNLSSSFSSSSSLSSSTSSSLSTPATSVSSSTSSSASTPRLHSLASLRSFSTSASSSSVPWVSIQSTPFLCALPLQPRTVGDVSDLDQGHRLGEALHGRHGPLHHQQHDEAFLLWHLLRRHCTSATAVSVDADKLLARFHKLMQLHKDAARQREVQRQRAAEERSVRAMGGLVREAVVVRGREVIRQTNDFVTAVVATFLCVFLF